MTMAGAADRQHHPAATMFLLLLTGGAMLVQAAVPPQVNCPETKEGMLNVHLLCHTHDDVGWLKTVDQYYYGDKQGIQNAGVQYIIDSVITALSHDPEKRFTYAESAFFWRWLSEQGDQTRHLVKRLVQEGRLEIAGGGWCQNDEAAAHYTGIVDQVTLGHRFLNDTLGPSGMPRAAWQLDPFGHSREHGFLAQQMGYAGLFIGRLHYQTKDARLTNKTMEYMWKVTDDSDTKFFTHTLYNNYSPPPGFCFDLLCGDTPMMDNPRLEGYNVDVRVAQFEAWVKGQSVRYRKPHVLVTMGNDFNYQAASVWFKNLDKLIKYSNAKENGIHLLYSTPACYLQAVGTTGWPEDSSDMFPYASDPHAYWTGYFTSRASFKGHERLTNSFMQVCSQLASLLHQQNSTTGPSMDVIRRAVGVAQHHDAITGTAKQHVSDDYSRRLSEGWQQCSRSAEASLNQLLSTGDDDNAEFSTCTKLNISWCDQTESNKRIVVTVYNPLAQQQSGWVRLPVVAAPANKASSYTVLGPTGEKVPNQLVPVPAQVLNLPGRNSSASWEVVFKAENLPALGTSSFYVLRSAGSRGDPQRLLKSHPEDGETVIGFEAFQVVFDSSGFVTAVIRNGKRVVFNQELMYYKGHAGNNTKFEFRASGAYIFRPDGQQPVKVTDKATLTVVKGSLVHEARQQFAPWLTQIVRVYDGEESAEFDWIVGPIPIKDGIGKEVIWRVTSDLKTNGKFLTDLNGRQRLERVRDLTNTEPVSGNYYPVTSFVGLSEGVANGRHIGILVDRAEGASSLEDGQAEVMLHRRLLYDDAFGVGEALNETAFGKGLVVKGRIVVIVDPDGKSWSPQQHRLLPVRLTRQPQLFFTPTKLSFQQWAKAFRTQFAPVSAQPDPQAHMLTLQPWKGRSVLLRLENVYQARDGGDVTVNIEEMFNKELFSVGSVEETTLSTAHWMADIVDGLVVSPSSVTISPMQIRTFVLHPKD